MLESGSSGSVRGVLSNEHPYREPAETTAIPRHVLAHHWTHNGSIRDRVEPTASPVISGMPR